jgi:hypothetical protein
MRVGIFDRAWAGIGDKVAGGIINYQQPTVNYQLRQGGEVGFLCGLEKYGEWWMVIGELLTGQAY